MPPTHSALLPTTLSHLRTFTSLAFLFLPSFTLRQFLLPDTTNNTAVTSLRFAGVRELVVAQTLLFAVRSWRKGRDGSAGRKAGVTEGTGLLADSHRDVAEQDAKAAAPKGGEKAQRERERMVAYALLAGAAVDGLDVLVCALGYLEGTVPGEAALLTACMGAVASLAGFGVLMGGGWRL